MPATTDIQDQIFATMARVEQEKVFGDEKESFHAGSIEKAGSSQRGDVLHHPEVTPEGELWVLPTEDEKSGPNRLGRIADKVPWTAYSIGIVEMAERFSYYGSTAVFTNFIQQPLPRGSRTGAGGHDHVSGALGRGIQAATGLTTFNQFWVYVIPLFGAYIADTKLGRYKTISWAVFIAMIGHVLLIVSSVPGVIEHSSGALACFTLALIVMGLGTGGFKANISPLVAEQYQVSSMRIKTLSDGTRVIVDPAVTTARIYLYFYLLINVGALVGQLGMTYSEKYVGFWLAYTLPTVFFFICPIVLFLGRHRYKQSPPQGSIVVEALRVWRTAMKGTVVWSSPVQTWRNWTHPDFWENAKPSRILKSQPEGGRPSWLTYDDIFVDEVRRGLKACQVFLFFPCYWICYNPLNSTLTSQAATMTTNGVPNDVINNLDPLALIIFIPICDYVIYPWFARMGIRFTPIKRIFFGFMTAVAAMVWAAVVQYYIYQTSPCGYQANSCDTPSHLNVWIQSGSYILIAFSEIFASITGLEYAFTKAPKNMRSVVMSVFLFMTAISSAITEALNPLAADPHLIWNYGSAAIIGFVSGIAFWICFRHLDKQEDKLNEITAMTGTGLKMVDERDSI